MGGTTSSTGDGRSVLIVEDEYFIAQELVRALRRNQFDVVGPVGDIADTLSAIEANPAIDGALLDINLRGEYVFRVADVLRDKAIPFVFTTGYDVSSIPAAYAGVPRWRKPFDYDDLASALPGLIVGRRLANASSC